MYIPIYKKWKKVITRWKYLLIPYFCIIKKNYYDHNNQSIILINYAEMSSFMNLFY